MRVDPALVPVTRAENGTETLRLSDAGGLRQFGCYLETLPPGAGSSDRHWHSNEDEFLFLLSGSAVVVDNFGEHTLSPGDAICWPHGEANAHRVENRGAEPCRYLILGSRVESDICHYLDLGRRLINTPTTWAVVGDDGTRLRGGDLPAHLLNLAPLWGQPAEGPARTRILPASSREWVEEDAYTHPILGGGLGPYRHSVLGDIGGVSQFGVHLEELPPGSRSSFRHWHEDEDEMILLLSGKVVLVEDTETPLAPGDTACWPTGQPTGHQLQNRSDAPAIYLTIGTRHVRDVIHYPDHDLITHKDGKARRYTHANGTPYPQGGTK
jgi:uncharacterized cupin superfamily protein